MSHPILLKLDVVDVLQILDALGDRAEAWKKTEAILGNHYEIGDFFVPEECNDADEAAAISQHFRDIIATIQTQLNASSG